MGIVISYTIVSKSVVIKCLNCGWRVRPPSIEYIMREVGEQESLECRVYFYDKNDNIVSNLYPPCYCHWIILRLTKSISLDIRLNLENVFYPNRVRIFLPNSSPIV